MRITASGLRRIIRSVITESSHMSREQIKSQMSDAAKSCIDSAERDQMMADLQDEVTRCLHNMPDLSLYGFERGVTHEDVFLMDRYIHSSGIPFSPSERVYEPDQFVDPRFED